MKLDSFSRSAASITLSALMGACQISSAAVADDPIRTAEYALTEVAGGHGMETTVKVDFEAGTYAVRQCDMMLSAMCLTPGTPPRALSEADRARLTERIRSTSFRQLHPRYDVPVRPDVSEGRLTVTTAAGEQTITWDRRGTIPAVLEAVECRLLALAGWLVLCT